MFWGCSMIKYDEIIPVGSKFTMFNSLSLKNVESASLFEALPNDLGYVEAIFLSNISDEELESLANGNISIRYIKSKEGFLLALLHFEASDLFIEMDFDPTKYEENRALQLMKSNNNIYFIGIESTTLEVKVNRKNAIPLKLANAWASSWDMAFSTKDYSKKYSNWISSLQRKYDSYELWQIATPIDTIKS